MKAQIISLNVGRPKHMHDVEPWTSGIHKAPVSGPVRLALENLEGDGQADLMVHGGPDKAICVYSADHYPLWREELGVAECGPGWFGENFSVTGQTESTVAIGDTYRVGTAVVQVSQPRAPCWKLGRRWNRLDMPKIVVGSGRTGWYLRVLETGTVECGETLTLLDRPYPQWTIAIVNDVAYSRRGATDVAAARALSSCPALAEAWRSEFRDLVS
ncbi:MAG: MOSC domain-containing protein [Acidobacteria bacterium]|nr:MAG: MOSC domain-containing protein [Acidobacteriota bacterium]